jgi:hypothetical protein
LYLVVLFNPVEEGLAGSGKLEVLNADMDAFGDNSVSDLLVDDNSDGAGVDVEDCSGTTVVDLDGSALVDGSVNNDVNDVTSLVGGKTIGDVDGSVLSEALSEFVSGLAVESVAMSHGNK